MRNFKRLICLALVVVFAFSMLLTGCGEKKTEPVSSDKGTVNSDVKVENTADDTASAEKTDVPKDKVKLTMTLVGNKQENDTQKVMDKIAEYLKDKLNVELDLQVYGWNDPYDQKVNTMLSSGEPFDICFTAGWAANYYVNANLGYFTELNQYLEKYPAVYEICGKDFVDASAINGKNYAVPTNKENCHNWGYLVLKEYANKYGLDPAKITKMEDLEPYFEKAKADGLTPLLVVSGDSPFMFLDWDRISDDNVPGALYPDNRDNKIINQFFAPESVAMFKKLREYYNKGYIAKDAATMENTSEQMATGKYFAVEQSLKPGKDVEMSQSTKVEWVQIDLTKPVMTNRETTGAMLAIPAASKNPDRAYQFIDMLYTDATLRNFLTYGIEGEHYIVNPDGRITITQNGKDNYGGGNGFRYGDQFKDLLLDTEDPHKWELFKAYNNGLKMNSLGFMFDGSSVDNLLSACKTVVNTYNKELYCGAIDVDTALPKFESELKQSGSEELIAEMQKQYDAWLAAKGK